MSILSKNNQENNSIFFREFKKQASFFLKTARLALTDVTPAELLTEEATNGNLWAPDTRTLASISRSAFEIDDYTRIVDILHKRLVKFEKKNWRECYNSAIVLEHLLTHGPESVALEFQSDKDVIKDMGTFQYIDERGFNWGVAARKKSDRVLKLLEKGPLLKEERDRARKLSRGIHGFGSFVQRPSSTQQAAAIWSDNSSPDSSMYGGSNSHSSSCEKEEQSEISISSKSQTSLKENVAPELHGWNGSGAGESSGLLLKGESGAQDSMEDDDHPFGTEGKQIATSLLCVTKSKSSPMK